jgi:hypothetical protein
MRCCNSDCSKACHPHTLRCIPTGCAPKTLSHVNAELTVKCVYTCISGRGCPLTLIYYIRRVCTHGSGCGVGFCTPSVSKQAERAGRGLV